MLGAAPAAAAPGVLPYDFNGDGYADLAVGALEVAEDDDFFVELR